ncbi:unnamed protein product [Periconia digitata]|uniref:DUF7137 domain-containing protein n=1 Tax=Periconia digitata TaxID=1303443 RepID=A0A9W4XQS4_9PLEO|nr:unnamed protein product [Periconia digitata]
MRPAQLLAAVMAMSSVSAALPDVFSDFKSPSQVRDILVGRQDNQPDSSATTTEPPKSSDAPKPSDSPSQTNSESSKETGSGDSKPSGDSKSSGDNKSSGDSKPTDKNNSKSGSKTSGKPTPTNFGPDVQPGGVNMITPSALAGTQLYKIDDYVTFVFNYTSLSSTPKNVDVMATCTANQATYTIAVNQTTEPTHTIVWDTKNYAADHPNSQPLLTENFQLMIYDSNKSVTDVPQPGLLSPFKGLNFAMYEKQPYVNWTDYKCANCNGAMGAMEALTVKAMLITSTTTVASFLYFAAAFGLW